MRALGTAVPPGSNNDPELAKTVRIWPHQFQGEGHFIAVLRRTDDGYADEVTPFQTRISKASYQIWQAFEQEHLWVNFDKERLHEANGRLYLIPENAPNTTKLKLVRYGLLLGEIRKNYVKPAHTLALALSPQEVAQTASWAANASEIERYLAGQDVPSEGENGWVLVTVDGFGLGWGKRVNGRLKNHYPKGLRR